MAASTGQSDSGTVVEQLIKSQGPLPLSETMYSDNLTKEQLERKLASHEDIAYVFPRSSNGTHYNSFSVGVGHEPVVYHVDHDIVEAVDVWLDANSQILRHSSSWAVYSGLIENDEKYDDEAVQDLLEYKDPDGWK